MGLGLHSHSLGLRRVLGVQCLNVSPGLCCLGLDLREVLLIWGPGLVLQSQGLDLVWILHIQDSCFYYVM